MYPGWGANPQRLPQSAEVLHGQDQPLASAPPLDPLLPLDDPEPPPAVGTVHTPELELGLPLLPLPLELAERVPPLAPTPPLLGLPAASELPPPALRDPSPQSQGP